MSERFRCALTSCAHDEPLLGTASPVRRWLLVEQPGPWGADALQENRLPPPAVAWLRRQARLAGARALLIRRRRRHGRRQLFAVSSGPADPFIERFWFDDPAELTSWDLTPLRRGRRSGGEPVTDPLLLCCTHGAHDPCCAEFGRPTAAALRRVAGPLAWETSHIGGDRFAANVLWLPYGIYYGRVEPDDVPNLVALARQERISLPHLRGRSARSFRAQAAEVLLRQRLGLDRIDAPVLLQAHDEGDVTEAVFADGARTWTVRLRTERSDEPQQLTCRTPVAAHPPRYRLLDIAADGSVA